MAEGTGTFQTQVSSQLLPRVKQVLLSLSPSFLLCKMVCVKRRVQVRMH